MTRSTPTAPRRSRGLWGGAVPFAAILTALVSLIGVQPRSTLAAEPPSPAETKAEYRRPNTIPFPADNPYTEAKAKLGELLFFDPRLSGTRNVSCATCHTPSLGWSDGLPVSIGANNAPMGRHSQTLLNLAWSELFMWDGRMATLEEQVLGPLLKPDIMNQTMVPLLGEIESIPDYRRQFKAVFPNDPVNVETIAKAIATFERTIVSNKAPFDRWIDGDEKAISESAQRGFVLFNSKANCAACHNTWRFTDDGYHDIGIDDDDPGRGRFVPDVPVLDHAFKTPTLRNITQRAPYMHHGKIATLEDVVLHYATGFVERPSLSPEMHRLELTNQDIADLVEFMRALTSEDDPVVIPVLPTKETM